MGPLDTLLYTLKSGHNLLWEEVFPGVLWFFLEIPDGVFIKKGGHK